MRDCAVRVVNSKCSRWQRLTRGCLFQVIEVTYRPYLSTDLQGPKMDIADGVGLQKRPASLKIWFLTSRQRTYTFNVPHHGISLGPPALDHDLGQARAPQQQILGASDAH